MPSALRAAAKTGVRKLTRAVGYEIAPFAAGFTAVQQKVLQDCSVVVDVGANVGQYAERLRDLGYRSTIISFEPGSAAFRILHDKAAGDPRWDVRQAALGPKSGTATLRISANSVSSSLLDVGDVHVRAAPKSEVVEREEVRLSTLDEELHDLADDHLYLKLDVQGFELPVLSGADRVLERTGAVQVEVSFDYLYEGQSDWLTLCRFLQDRGFLVRYIERGYEDKQSGFMLQADLLFLRAAS